MSHGHEDEDYLDIVPDPTVKEILRKQINEVAFSDEKFNKKMEKSKQVQSGLNMIQRPLEMREEQQNQYEDYETELNPYKRDRMYEFLEPEKFKRLNISGKRAVFRLTDLYLPPSERVERLIDRIFREKIHGRQGQQEGQLQSVFDNTQQLQKIYNQWETKEDFDEFQNDRNELTQKQLEEIVVNMGDKKGNYFLLVKNQKQTKRVEVIQENRVKNLPIANPHFLKNLKKQVSQLAQKNKIVEEFQSEDDRDYGDEPIMLGQAKDSKKAEQPTTSKLFGTARFSSQKSSLPSSRPDPLSYPIVQEMISLQLRDKHVKSFNEQLIKYYSYSNDEVVRDAHMGPLQKLNRIEYNLANPEFFLPKLHIALQRQQEFGSVKGGEYKQQGQLFGKSGLSQLNKSKFSDSLFTGNRQGQFSKPSLIDGSGEQIYPLLQEQQQTIQRRIQSELRNIYKQPLHHSQLAVKFDLVRFTLEEDEFEWYHRYQFPYCDFFRGRTEVRPVAHKQRRPKPKDLIINVEMKNSNIKFAKQEALSLSQGEFILIEYLEQNPLVLSTTGMCQRMFVQVNYQEMLQKISQDLIKNAQIDDIQELRDNPNKVAMGNNLNGNTSGFERKCELWRENVKETFGENGKLFLWEPKMAGKLIGSPEGLGVAVMESNLATYPIVKKKPPQNSRDFLLVNENGKWYIRRIDSMYISGQIEPKKKIFNPDSRQYTVFKSNYEKAFMRREISMYGSVNFDQVRRTFAGESEASLKKALKAIRATSNDNRNYTILDGFDGSDYELTAEDVCLYERMQKSICLLKQVGVTQIRNNEKMKNVLKQFNKRYIQSLQKFTISRMIKDQLLLTSWYLTDSFIKFKIKAAKIEIVGMADPTNGRGGYSFINKPQKERTAREDMDQKAEKPKVSGTKSDLRKLKRNNTTEFLISRGHKQQQLRGKGRWGLVGIIRKEADTEYARKERETKAQKAQNQKKQISRMFNKMLAYLNGDQVSPVFNYNFRRKVTLEELMEKERAVWAKTRERILKGEKEQEDQGQEDDDFEDEQQEV